MSNEKFTETILGQQVEFTLKYDWKTGKSEYDHEILADEFTEAQFEAAEARCAELNEEYELECAGWEEDQRLLSIWERDYRGY